MRNNSILTIVALLLLGLNAGAQQSLYDLKFRLSASNFVDTIPVECVGNRVVLPVSIGGRDYRFLFDTGASQTTLYDDMPIEGTTVVGTTVSHDAMNRPDSVARVALPPMTIGAVTFTGCKAVVQKRIGKKAYGFDGIVGFDIICKGLNAKIDLRAGHIILTDRSRLFSREPGARIGYTLQRHVPYVEVTPLPGFTERVLLDTGSPFLYMMNKQSFDRAEQLHAEALSSMLVDRTTGRYTMGHGGAEPVGEVVTMLLDSLQTGRLTLYEVPVRTTQGLSHLGAGLLQLGTLVVCPQRRRLLFQPY